MLLSWVASIKKSTFMVFSRKNYWQKRFEFAHRSYANSNQPRLNSFLDSVDLEKDPDIPSFLRRDGEAEADQDESRKQDNLQVDTDNRYASRHTFNVTNKKYIKRYYIIDRDSLSYVFSGIHNIFSNIPDAFNPIKDAIATQNKTREGRSYILIYFFSVISLILFLNGNFLSSIAILGYSVFMINFLGNSRTVREETKPETSDLTEHRHNLEKADDIESNTLVNSKRGFVKPSNAYSSPRKVRNRTKKRVKR